MLQESGIVRARAQGADRQIPRGIGGDLGGVARVLVGARRGASHLHPGALRAPSSDTPVSGSVTSAPTRLTRCCREWLPCANEKAAAVAVGVDVDDPLLLELRGVGLDPFGGAEQHRLLAVPAGIDQRALRPPAGFRQRADGLRLGHHGDVPAQRIGRAEHPAVMVVAAHDPLVGIGAALHHRDDVVDRLERPLGFDRQMDARGVAAADVIGDRQRPAPIRRHHRPPSAARKCCASP